MVHEPGLGSDASAVADEDGTAVVLVGVVDGAGDKVDGLADVGAREDETFAIDGEVVSEDAGWLMSEVRLSIMTRLTTAIFSV